MTGTNLAATVPTVSGAQVNAYGHVLRGLSQYLKDTGAMLPTFTNQTCNLAQWQAFTGAYNNAYRTANPGGNMTFGTCRVNVQGTVSASAFTVPLNLDYCFTDIGAGSCSADNATLSQGVAGQGGLLGAANLRHTYSAACVAGALRIALQ